MLKNLGNLFILLRFIFSYNNKTYRVDDIDWDKHPTDSFSKADGTTITFKEYYEAVYEQQVKGRLIAIRIH